MEALDQNIEGLHLPPGIRKDLGRFCRQLATLYGDELVSLTVVGSAAGTTYREGSSDLNLLVVYSDLNIADLGAVADLARKWLRKRRFAPRFLSRRNLLSSAGVFPLDTLEMRERHVVLHGEDLLATTTLNRQALVWQVSSELKSMRLRIKQQFWRSASDPTRMARILQDRFASLLLLARGVLILEDRDPGPGSESIRAALAGQYGLDRVHLDFLAGLRDGETRLDRGAVVTAFSRLAEVIRVLDDQAEELRR